MNEWMNEWSKCVQSITIFVFLLLQGNPVVIQLYPVSTRLVFSVDDTLEWAS